MLVYCIHVVDITFQPGHTQQCTSYNVMDNEVFESSPLQSFTVSLSSSQSRVSADGITMVTVNDDDGEVEQCT